MVQSMQPKQQLDEDDTVFWKLLSPAESTVFSLRRSDLSIDCTHSTMDTISEPRATDPRL
jgi:hypothetical protein